MPVNHTPEFLVLYHSLKERASVDPAWTKIASSFNSPLITRGHIYKIVDKCWEPLKNDLREALGLPVYKPVPACPICGSTHTHAHDELPYNPATQVVKPLRKQGKPRPARIAIRKDDMKSAARSIVNNLDDEYVKQLIYNLAAARVPPMSYSFPLVILEPVKEPPLPSAAQLDEPGWEWYGSFPKEKPYVAGHASSAERLLKICNCGHTRMYHVLAGGEKCERCDCQSFNEAPSQPDPNPLDKSNYKDGE